MTSTKLWINKVPNQELFQEFVTQGFFTPLLAKILINKGFSDIKSAYSFLYPQLSDFSNPFIIPDMKLAVERIFKAIKAKEKIVIYGDSDADGIIGTFILYDFLKNFTPYVDWLIPSKTEEGYGFHAKFLPYFKAKGISLIITVDVGISAYHTVNSAKALNIDVIVTDHHEIISKPETITISGKLTQPSSPLYYLCGAGVVFALIRALRSYLLSQGFFVDKEPPFLRKYLELVSLATLADMVPLIGENRLITFFGFRDLLNPYFPCTKILLERENLKYGLSEEDLYYKIIPKFNSAGRLGKPEIVFEFLSSVDKVSAEKTLSQIENLNQERQTLEEEILKTLNFQLNNVCEDSKFLFLTFENIPKGLLGLIANRFKNLYNLPTIVISQEDEIAHGSIRSPSEINFLKILSQCEDLLIQFGGHKYALGFKIHKNLIPEFKIRLEKILKSNHIPSSSNLIYIDAETNLSELLYRENLFAFEAFHPYGEGHSPPALLLKNFEIKEIKILKEKHSKLILQKEDKELSAIFFNKLLEKKEINLIVGTPFINSFTGNLELKIEDVK
ncbi:single-stranded-DNA-specific exonuclease RecJ [Thermodesulfobacterium geofontis OPF15]|jgi:single-stranded-DNA-specific exonuclease|uniref:Single-stranded-DNA-specific exonuclease RecJ n=1 Tax=Thermodesulfobacterium geofontis (strain OPF15) TaxID=795359 RepID=F8C3Q5_THEGP|nr:single-stranded-DNA-specific exonuclease RecJ [Thermodesulfobacterium geofontis]AEH22506.1 single-stranded-DNA-specific exonuclease RecJ [Thermodesulfobacterium geofontis OPF15]